METADIITLAWLIVGVLLVIGEVFIPGLVAVFLGAAAICVAGLRYVGIIETLVASIFSWIGLSVGFTLALRSAVKKYLPSETTRGQISEEIQALGMVVEVLEDINAEDDSGRIRFQGTTWPATCSRGRIPKGAKAQLVLRQNLSWLVEPAGALPEPDGMEHWAPSQIKDTEKGD